MVAIVVVDLLEEIQVHIDHDKTERIALRHFANLDQSLHNVATVEHARQVISGGHGFHVGNKPGHLTITHGDSRTNCGDFRRHHNHASGNHGKHHPLDKF